MVSNVPRRVRLFALFFLSLPCLLLLVACNGDKAEETSSPSVLEVPGTGACENVLGAIAAAYEEMTPGAKVVVPPSVGSTGGIQAVGEGTAVLARVGRRPKDSEAHFGLEYQAFARDAIVFAVGRGVSGVESLTPDQILDIFSGRITAWDEVGGPERPINLITREKGETTRKAVAKVMPGFSDHDDPVQAKLVYRDFEVIELLEKFPTSIGYTTLSNLQASLDKVTVLGFDGATAGSESLASGAYPFSLEMGFVFRPGKLDAPARAFLDFVTGEKGAAAIRAQGMIPVEAGR